MAATHGHKAIGFILIASIASMALLALLSPRPLAGDGLTLGAPVASQTPVGSDIRIDNLTGPAFAWMGDVPFTITIFSNVSTTLTIECASDAFLPVSLQQDIDPGSNVVNLTCTVSVFGLPGDRNATFTVTYGGDSAVITHEMWVGSSIAIVLIVLFATVIIGIVLVAKIGEKGVSTGTATPGYATASGPSGDDDNSTVTYVDQSRAPPGRIFCPECKKTIEEGSIFCAECGTRIPRYLRYRP